MFPIFLGKDPRGKTMGIKDLEPSVFEILATIVAGIPEPTSIDIEASKLDKNAAPYFDESIAETISDDEVAQSYIHSCCPVSGIMSQCKFVFCHNI